MGLIIQTFQMHFRKTVLTVLAALLSVAAWGQDFPEGYPDECTSIAAGRLATTDGSVFTTHACDGTSRTWTTVEPAAKHPAGAMHRVYKGTRRTSFPSDTTGLVLAGEIPQARRTYAYLNTGYPCLNEKQVAIGETTFSGPDTLRNYGAMFNIEELCRLALMRCDNARDAVKLMGRTAERYGYCDGGECLTVADKNEVWFFEIIGCGRGKTGAVWVARRVPDGEVAVSANIPRIGTVDRKDKANFMASDNVESVALEYGLWDGKEPFKFWKAYNAPYGQGKNFREREFFIFNELAPSLGLTFDMDELPFSVKPDKKVDLHVICALMRSTYEGTEFDMCRNLTVEVPATKDVPAHVETSPLANPWPTGDTRNLLNALRSDAVVFRRTVSVAWCAYSTVLQLRNFLPDSVGGICWLSLDNPGESPRIPIFSGTTELPGAFDKCGHKQYVPDCALWQFRRANRLATVAWQKDRTDLEKEVLRLEDLALEGLPALEADPSTGNLNAYTARIYDEAAKAWDALEALFWHRHGRGF